MFKTISKGNKDLKKTRAPHASDVLMKNVSLICTHEMTPSLLLERVDYSPASGIAHGRVTQPWTKYKRKRWNGKLTEGGRKTGPNSLESLESSRKSIFRFCPMCFLAKDNANPPLFFPFPETTNLDPLTIFWRLLLRGETLLTFDTFWEEGIEVRGFCGLPLLEMRVDFCISWRIGSSLSSSNIFAVTSLAFYF